MPRYTLLSHTDANLRRYITGTGRVGEIEATYDRVRETLGNEALSRSDGKTQVEWWLLFWDGTLATIYDYKADVPYQEVTRWSVGGHGQQSLELVTDLMAEEAPRAN